MKKKIAKTQNPYTMPAALADKVLKAHLSNTELFGQVIELPEKEFERIEHLLPGGRMKDRPADANEREMLRQEVMFYIGLELGRRIGGVR